MSSNKHRCLLGLEIYQIESSVIEKIREKDSKYGGKNFYNILPKYIFDPKSKKEQIKDNFYFQFSSGQPDDKWIMFNVVYQDPVIEMEVDGGDIISLLRDADVVKFFEKIDLTKNYQNPMDVSLYDKISDFINTEIEKRFPIPNRLYLVIDIEYVCSPDYYSGGTDCDTYITLIGWLDGEMNLVKI